MRSLITVALALVLLGHQPARADETAFDPDRLALAREMVEVSGASALSMQMLELVNAEVAALIRQFNPDEGAAAAEIVDAVLMPEFRRRLPEMSEAVARIYAERFTAAELKDVVDFYRTATGQKLVASGSELLAEGQRVGQAWAALIIQENWDKLVGHLKEEGLKAPPI